VINTATEGTHLYFGQVTVQRKFSVFWRKMFGKHLFNSSFEFAVVVFDMEL